LTLGRKVRGTRSGAPVVEPTSASRAVRQVSLAAVTMVLETTPSLPTIDEPGFSGRDRTA
jgi:hypothetical protein